MKKNELEFHDVYDEFHERIRRYLRRMVGRDEAEDLTQEVFVKINKGLEGFEGESELSTWMYRIATNAALDRKGCRWFPLIPVILGALLLAAGYYLDAEITRILWMIAAGFIVLRRAIVYPAKRRAQLPDSQLSTARGENNSGT